jgi:hypothetical protein
MYNISSIENGWADLAKFFLLFITARRRWPDIFQCTQTIHKSWMAGRKSNFSSKKCRRQRIESQDTTFVTRRLGVIQIYWYSLWCYWSCKLSNRVLNSLDLPGKPPHNLQMKVGSPVILLHNLNPPRLYNGTRLVVKKWMKNVIEAIILNGKFRGENILLLQISIKPKDVQFKRLQFPIILAFEMTINKYQMMSICGLDLSTSCFLHRQLYVACSRTIQFVCVDERWDSKKYCTLSCIKGLILFFY